MSSNVAGNRSWAERLDLEAPSREVEAFRGQGPSQSDEQDFYRHDTIPAPPPDDAEDFELDAD